MVPAGRHQHQVSGGQRRPYLGQRRLPPLQRTVRAPRGAARRPGDVPRLGGRRVADRRLPLRRPEPCLRLPVAFVAPARRGRRRPDRAGRRADPHQSRIAAHRGLGVERRRDRRDGPAAVPCAVPVLRGRGASLVPAVPAQRRHVPRRAVQHRLLRPADLHDGAGVRLAARRVHPYAGRHAPLPEPSGAGRRAAFARAASAAETAAEPRREVGLRLPLRRFHARRLRPVARDQGPDVVLNPQQMNILIPTVSPESVEALVFDLGGVLLDVQLQRTLRAFEALDIRGLGAAEVIDGNRACFRDLELGLITQEEFAEAVRRTFPAVAAIPDEQLLEAWNAMLMPFDVQRVELLRELGKRCPVYLLSNTNLPHRIRFRESFRERFGGSFDELFVRCFYSDELHLRKPDPEIYRSVARQIGTPPGKLLFIDDNAANVSAARGEGWQACHLTGGITVTDLFEL